jgi:hypothetical protein
LFFAVDVWLSVVTRLLGCDALWPVSQRTERVMMFFETIKDDDDDAIAFSIFFFKKTRKTKRIELRSKFGGGRRDVQAFARWS